MPQRKILLYPDALLKKVCAPVREIDDTVKRIITDLTDTMLASPGVGLAAPQIGILKRIIVIDVTPRNPGRGLVVLINPVIEEKKGLKTVREGCLSIPQYTANIKRAKEVTVSGLGPDGKPLAIKSSGFEAVVLQHEIDHLDGILFIDRIDSIKRLIRRK